MGDRVAVMKSGASQQCAQPETLYNAPVNVFVAGFIGSPPMNLYRVASRVTREACSSALSLCRWPAVCWTHILS